MKKQLPMMPPQNIFNDETQLSEPRQDVLEQIGLYDCYQGATKSLHAKADEAERKS